MQEYLDHAKAVALEAGGLILKSFGPGIPYSYKPDRTPVTETDIEVNQLVIDRLSAAFPDHSLMGEEGSVIKEGPFVWVFDPIDGTVPYVRGIPTNAFSLALVEDGEPIVGVIYDPYLNHLYYASKGGGCFIGDVRLHVSGATEVSGTYVVTDGRNYFRNLSFLERFRENNLRFLSYSSTVYGQMLVANGQVEGAVYSGSKPWDQAAAKILIEEAGGVTSSLRGQPQRYDGEIDGFVSAGTPDYHEKLLGLLAPSLPV